MKTVDSLAALFLDARDGGRRLGRGDSDLSMVEAALK
jgi:hypothetical protein